MESKDPSTVTSENAVAGSPPRNADVCFETHVALDWLWHRALGPWRFGAAKRTRPDPRMGRARRSVVPSQQRSKAALAAEGMFNSAPL